jgi:hypothetical protein
MLGRTLEQKAVWTYRFASLVAIVEAFFLFIFGLDLTTRQTWLFTAAIRTKMTLLIADAVLVNGIVVALLSMRMRGISVGASLEAGKLA